MADPMKWFINQKMWVRLTIAAVIFIPFVSWIVWLNVTYEEKVVWSPKAKQWERTPIRVYAQDFGDATDSAIDIWNGAAKCKVLERISHRDDADVIVKSTDGTPCGKMDAPGMLPNHAGGAYYCGSSPDEVHVAYPGDLRQQLVVVGHELGHIIGFGDDDPVTTCRIMAGNIKAVYNCDLIYPSDADTKALRKRYCRKGGE